MTLKLTLNYTNGMKAVAYVADTAYILVGNNIIKAETAKSISVLTHVNTGKDNLIHAMNNLIIGITSVEKVDGVVASYIDPAKVTDVTFPVIGVFIPKNPEVQSSEQKAYKLYFAMINECSSPQTAAAE